MVRPHQGWRLLGPDPTLWPIGTMACNCSGTVVCNCLSSSMPRPRTVHWISTFLWFRMDTSYFLHSILSYSSLVPILHCCTSFVAQKCHSVYAHCSKIRFTVNPKLEAQQWHSSHSQGRWWGWWQGHNGVCVCVRVFLKREGGGGAKMTKQWTVHAEREWQS